MKKGIIYQYHCEIMTWKENGSVMMDFMKLHIAAFYRDNQKNLDEIMVVLKALQEKFMEHDADGKIKMQDATTPIFKEGFTMADYEKAYSELMEQEAPEKEVTEVPLNKNLSKLD